MQLYEPIYNGGIIDEILRMCQTTSAVYSNKAMVARINNALDKYWFLASSSAPKGTFDDTNQSSLPVETQSLVSGTNAYKISSFTNEVLQVLKLSILDDNAKEMDLCREEFEDLDDFQELYSTDSGDQGIPQYWTKMGDYIYIRPCPNYSETNGLRAYVNRELSKYTFKSFTVDADTEVFTSTGHGLVANDAVIFETDGTIPTGLTADTVVYYVISTGLTADAFKVSTTIGGSSVNVTNAQTASNHKFLKVNKEPGIPVIHHEYLARMAALPFLIENKLSQKNDIAALILKDEQQIMDYWANRDRDLKTVITSYQRSFK